MDSALSSCLLIGSFILFVSILLSKSSEKFGMPLLIIFMILGVAIGDEGLSLVKLNADFNLTYGLSLVALCLIIFSGGLQTKLSNAKQVMGSGVSLSSLGILLTTALIAAFSYTIFQIELKQALLLGAILSATDAAAVFSLLRNKNSQIQKKVKDVIELESGSNDPMAYFLVTFFLGTEFNFSSNYFAIVSQLLINPILGLGGGFVLFKAYKWINEKITLEFQGLYPLLILSFLFLAFAGVNKIGGNGFLAVYTFGMLLGNAKLSHKKTSLSFFDGTTWLFQIGLFVLLGLLVSPGRLIEVAPYAIALSLLLQFIARPLTVFICMAFSPFGFKEKLLVSWSGLKGATSIVFASFVAQSLGGEVLFLFDIVFFAVMLSILIQGSTVKLLAKKLNLYYEAVLDPDFPVDMEFLEKTKNGIKEYALAKSDFAVGKKLIDLDLPIGSVVLFIKRAGLFIIPDGTTEFQACDKVLLVTSTKDEVADCIEKFKNQENTELDIDEKILSFSQKAA